MWLWFNSDVTKISFGLSSSILPVSTLYTSGFIFSNEKSILVPGKNSSRDIWYKFSLLIIFLAKFTWSIFFLFFL